MSVSATYALNYFSKLVYLMKKMDKHLHYKLLNTVLMLIKDLHNLNISQIDKFAKKKNKKFNN